jgi:hypothetical protein
MVMESGDYIQFPNKDPFKIPEAYNDPDLEDIQD